MLSDAPPPASFAIAALCRHVHTVQWPMLGPWTLLISVSFGGMTMVCASVSSNQVCC